MNGLSIEQSRYRLGPNTRANAAWERRGWGLRAENPQAKTMDTVDGFAVTVSGFVITEGRSPLMILISREGDFSYSHVPSQGKCLLYLPFQVDCEVHPARLFSRPFPANGRDG